MEKKYNFIVLSLLLYQNFIFGQPIPSYSERSLFQNKDTTLVTQYLSEPSEGPIDPKEYIIGPGDLLFISVSGIEEKTFNIKVNPEGFLYIPQIGVIDLRNKSLYEARDIIKERLLRSFKNVDVYITLQNFRKIKVSLIGNVSKASNYILSSSARLFDVFSISEGITANSDLRNIKVISKNGSENKYDLIKFLRLGDLSQNPALKDGDLIIVDKAERFVSLFGHIKYIGNYEYKPNETVSELLNLAGGLMFKAFKDSIEIIRFTKDGKTQYSTYFSYDYLLNNPIYTEPNDMIIVREIPEYFDLHYVTIEGEVRYPGVYKIIKGKTKLSEIIKEAGGFLDNASLVNSSLYRTQADSLVDPEYERLKLIPRAEMTDDEYDYLKAKSRQKIGKVVVDFESLFIGNKMDEDIILKSGDLITIPEEKEYITIIGQVVNPGNIPFRENFNVLDYINLSGGFGWRAIESDVRVIRSNTGEWVEADEVKRINPGDIIWVPEKTPPPKFWDVFTTSLQVVGQIAAVVAATVAVIVATR
jgi:protein involved in polysaccharide export with SLBB domain